MGTTHFSGPVDSAAGFSVNDVLISNTVNATNTVSVTAATLTVDAATHGGKLVKLDRAAGIVVTLPASTGGGQTYTFYVGTAVTSNNDIIKVANASDTMVGLISGSTFAGSGSFIEGIGGTDDTITMNGGTTGGLIGSYVHLTDMALNVWLVNGRVIGSGTMASYASATV